MKNTLLSIFLVMTVSKPVFATTAPVESEATPTLAMGSSVYAQRCVLCHGSQGMGEGVLPLKLVDYPNTNLLLDKRSLSRDEVHRIITYGAALENVSEYMPPMGDDLTWTELESVVDFVMLLKKDAKEAIALLVTHNAQSEGSDLWVGKNVYETRCVLCHGEKGLGDGRMSKVIKTPPPYNLTLSRLPKPYLIDIVSKGGAEMQRSPQMPPWGAQLSPSEINSVVDYIIQLRTY